MEDEVIPVTIVGLGDLDQQCSFSITDLHAFEMVPKKSVLHVQAREFNGFLYLLEGRCLYVYGSQSFAMEPGSLVYLPHGSRHKYAAASKSIRYIRIDFTLVDPTTGEEIYFDTQPLLLYNRAPVICDLKVRELAQVGLAAAIGSQLHSRALLLELLGLLSENEHGKLAANHENSKIIPGIRYIEQHYIEDISVTELAGMCYLSPSHFRRLFKACTGTTPVSYKNRLRMDRARQILRNGNCNINEVALQLGFDNVFYFSNLFKKIAGVSPSRLPK